jgi:hypothetical protein
MKMCQPHWDQLRTAIEERGLMGLVSKDGVVAVEKLSRELKKEGTETENFDPLMAANLAIWTNALEMGGAYLMFQDPEGNEYCPICEAIKNGKNVPQGKAEWWIDHAADEQLARARELKLVPGIQ